MASGPSNSRRSYYHYAQEYGVDFVFVMKIEPWITLDEGFTAYAAWLKVQKPGMIMIKGELAIEERVWAEQQVDRSFVAMRSQVLVFRGIALHDAPLVGVPDRARQAIYDLADRFGKDLACEVVEIKFPSLGNVTSRKRSSTP